MILRAMTVGAATALALFSSCGTSGGGEPAGSDTGDASTLPDAGADTGSGSDPDTGNDPDTATDPDTGADPDTGTDPDTATDAGSDPIVTVADGCQAICERGGSCEGEDPSGIDACVMSCASVAADAGPDCDPTTVAFATCFVTMTCDEIAAGPPTDPLATCHGEYIAYLESCLATDGERTCLPLGAGGDPCDNSSDCRSGFWCDDGACAAAAGMGQPCSDGTVCASGLACEFASMTCGEMPGEGDPCALGTYGPQVCPSGLGCLPSETGFGTCEQLPTEGDACTIDSRCAEGLGCDFTTEGSFCAPLRGAEEHCDSDQICGDGVYCEWSELVCRPYIALGGACEDGNECGPGAACLRRDGRYQCTATPSLGEPCDDVCAEGAVCR